MYGNVAGKEGEMNNKRAERDQPIAKPNSPLPGIFSLGRRPSESPTLRRQEDHAVVRERAHFYRKQTADTGSPMYGFYIIEAPANENRESH